MKKAWMYNDRSNARRRAVKRVEELIEIEAETEGLGSVNSELSVCLDNSEEFNMQVSDDESDQDLDAEDLEEAEALLSDEDMSDLRDQCQNGGDLHSSLANWAVSFGISLMALSALLNILRIYHPFLPKDGRTLLKTKTSHNIHNAAGGVFHYRGILNSFQKIFDKVWFSLTDGHVFKLQLNFDGLPLWKSSRTQFWPILGMLQGYTKKPVLIGLFCGTSKPNSLAEYLHDLVHELKALQSGFLFKQKSFFVNVVSVVCDTPARAFIRGVKSHNAYHGCDKCDQTGVRKCNRMTFPEVNARRRTDDSFRQAMDEEHHVQQSPLADVGIDMIACFPYDYMHLVCLGVMKRLLDLWISTTGPLRCRISSSLTSIISDRLLALRNYIPSEFTRRPRSLADRCRWKATEFRQFLLYTGPVVLRGVLKPQIYDNFLLLSVGVYILASPKYCLEMNDLANTLLVSFVEHFGQLYGEEFWVSNIHGLVHLSEDVKIHGNLDLISAFPYENFLGKLKKLVRGPCNPLTQVLRRLSEMENDDFNPDVKETPKLYKEHMDGPVPDDFSQRMFHIVVFDDTSEVEVVPSVWMKNGECMWPPNKSDVAKAVKSQECPGHGWKPHKARIIFTSYDYNEARLKLPQAVDNTDLGSDEKDSPIQFKRKRIRKNILFPGEEDDGDDNDNEMKVRKSTKRRLDSLPSAPKIYVPNITPALKRGKQNRPRINSTGHNSPEPMIHSPCTSRKMHSPRRTFNKMHTPRSTSSEVYSPRSTSRAVQTPRCTSREVHTPRRTSCEIHTPRRTGSKVHSPMTHTKRHTASSAVPSTHFESHQSSEKRSSLQTFLLHNILKQEMMLEQLRIIFQTLQGMKAADEAEMGLDPNLLPLKDVGSLQSLEEQLHINPDLQKTLVNTLALKGGVDIRKCVWSIMHAMINNSLARKINMRGINGKIGFQHLQIRTVVTAAVRRNRLTSWATDKEIDATIQRWLQLASDRDGGRKERMKRKEKMESSLINE
ncbi:uncharacterized protein LOC109521683 isoform X3 [Hippocampus comes]|uniref:uncharacterized protein LOC109521683 isoform X3 n=1 Tax=Hippocampus comes TaxID=109280 RepID=UPI00094E0C3B|nr:PREDICTED: uncharacterized protein LOC109521683 isoform X3 [Hippocampus comes]